MQIGRSIAGFFVLSTFWSSAIAGGWQTDKGPDCILIDKQQRKVGKCHLNHGSAMGISTLVFTWGDGIRTTLRLQNGEAKLNGIPVTQIQVNGKNSIKSTNCYRTWSSETVFCARVLGLY